LIERFTGEKRFLRVEFVAVGLPGAARQTARDGDLSGRCRSDP